MLNNNKKLVFDVDANQIKIKKLLKKDFLELSMKAISSANPNRNGSWFTPEAMEKALPTFYNKPILGCFSNGDFESHNGSWEKDGETGMSYWDTLGAKGERILGLIRSEDEVKIVEERGLKWITLTCALWTQYSFKQVKRLLKDAIRAQKEGGPTKSISVEIDVLDYDDLPNGVMKINDFKLVGITILGSRNGKKVEPGIEDAELSVLDMVGTDNYEKQRSELRMAYAKLDGGEVEKEAKDMPNEENIHREAEAEEIESDSAKTEGGDASEVPEATQEGKENFECGEKHEEAETKKCEEGHEEPCEDPECGECDECQEALEEDPHEEPQPEDKGVYDLAYLMGSMKYNIDDFSQCIEYYEDHKEEIKNAEYVIAVVKRAKKKAEGIAALFAKAIGSLAEDSEAEDPEKEEKLLPYEDCEEACCKYEALEAECAKIKCECADAEKKFEDLSKKYEEVAKKNAEFERREFVSKAKQFIASSGCEEAIRNKFCKECEDGKYHDIDTLKTDIAVAMFESNRSKVGNSDISLPISNPEVFSGDSAEKSSKKKSSWDTLNAYNNGEK